MEKTQAAPPTEKPAAPAANTSGPVDVNAIIAKVQVTPKFKAIYDKAILSGMRIMFSKESHAMMEEQLAKEGPLADKIAEGIIVLVYMLLKQSNNTLPPQIVVPVTFTLTLKAFDFLQKSEDPEATPAVMGEAVEKAVTGIMHKFGVEPGQVQALVKQYVAQANDGQAAAPAAPPAGPGMLQTGGVQ